MAGHETDHQLKLADGGTSAATSLMIGVGPDYGIFARLAKGRLSTRWYGE